MIPLTWPLPKIVLAVLALAGTSCFAQEYPSRTVRLIVPASSSKPAVLTWVSLTKSVVIPEPREENTAE